MNQERRGLRFPFSAVAEVFVERLLEGLPARATELSLRGCFLEISASLGEQQHVQIKIFYLDDYFEAPAEVIYLRPSGVGLVFGDVKPHFRGVLQEWILTALDSHAESGRH